MTLQTRAPSTSSTASEARPAVSPSLFITYDGLLDPLGGSQILPYVRAISGQPRYIHVLSFEKPERLEADAHALRSLLRAEGIGWTPLLFSPSRLGKVWDLARMYTFAIQLAVRHHLKVVHCRGHLAAQVGSFVKALTGARLLFDFRGLWVDERVDKGGWDLSNRLDRIVYRAFKWLERYLLNYSDQIVVLTQAIIPLLQSMGVQQERITVIPCCADFSHFQLPTPEARAEARRSLGLPESGIVIGYLGSIGAMYMTEEFLFTAETAIETGAATAVLCITPDVDRMRHHIRGRNWDGLGIVHRVVSARRNEVPGLLAAMDVMVSYFVPTQARIGTSPTKMAECFAQGISMVTNPGVGDVEILLSKLNAGVLVDPENPASIREACAHLRDTIAMGGQRLRDSARPLLGLEYAAERYRKVYTELEMK